jgi:hypothetical protein
MRVGASTGADSLSVTSRRGAVTLRHDTGVPPRAPVLERRIERSNRPLDATWT